MDLQSGSMEIYTEGWGAFSIYVRYEVGDGFQIRLFSIAPCKEAWVTHHMQFVNGNLQRSIDFIISVHDWKVDLVTAF